MTFTPKDWKDYPDTSTPITAAALEDLESRVTDYTDDEATRAEAEEALKADAADLATETSDRETADTALDGRLDVIEGDYLTSGNFASGDTLPDATTYGVGFFYETDEAVLYYSDGSTWTSVERRGEIAYGERTTVLNTQTNTSAADSGITLPTFTVGSRPVRVTLQWNDMQAADASTAATILITKSDNTILETAPYFPGSVAFASLPVRVSVRITAAGTYDLKARHYVSSASHAVSFSKATSGVVAGWMSAEEL